MTIFYIDLEDKASADALGYATNEAVLDFNIPTISEKEMTLVAHTSNGGTTIHDQGPEELAKVFSEKFKANKAGLKDLYLISCEAGMSKDKKPSFAKLFAEAMYEQGFKHINVHAITNPEGMPVTGMRVEVVTKQGVTLSQPGEVRAFSYLDLGSHAKHTVGQKSITEIKPLGEKDDVTASNNWQFNFFSAKNISSETHYKVLMSLPHNTFTPGVMLQPTMSMSTAYAIRFLQATQVEIAEAGTHMGEQKQKKYIDRIYKLIATLQKNPNQDASQIQTLLGDLLKKHTHLLSQSNYVDLVLKPLNQSLMDFEKELGSIRTAAQAALNSNPAPSLSGAIANPSSSSGQGIQQRNGMAAMRMKYNLPGTAPNRDANHVPTKSQTIALLEEYKRTRASEWDFHYNFLGIVAFVYTIIDAVTGSDHFSSKSREAKVRVTDRLIAKINGEDSPPFNEHEEKALSEGRLGSLVTKIGWRDLSVNSGEHDETTPLMRH